MSTCDRLSDRMPSVASGSNEWTPVEAAHLASCPDCAAEWALVRATWSLGRDLPVNAAGITTGLLEQVRDARRNDRRRQLVRSAQVGGLAIAAALLLILVPGRRDPTPAQSSTEVARSAPTELQLAELDDAAPAELEMVLVEFDEPAVPASTLDGPDLEGLDQSQVERILRSWEKS